MAEALPPRIVLMGVSGSGKTTLGERLAAHLGCAFYDADDFHPAANRAKMAAGEPLTRADREEEKVPDTFSSPIRTDSPGAGMTLPRLAAHTTATTAAANVSNTTRPIISGSRIGLDRCEASDMIRNLDGPV